MTHYLHCIIIFLSYISMNSQSTYFKEMQKSKQAGSVNENLILLLKSKHITDNNYNNERPRSTLTVIDHEHKSNLTNMVTRFENKIKVQKDANQDKFLRAIQESNKISQKADSRQKKKEEKQMVDFKRPEVLVKDNDKDDRT